MITSLKVDPRSIHRPLHVRPATPAQDESIDASIRAEGMLMPPHCRKLGDIIRCVDGWRRACSAVRLGLPVIIITVDDEMTDRQERVKTFKANENRVNSTSQDKLQQLISFMAAHQASQADTAREFDISPGWLSKQLKMINSLVPPLKSALFDDKFPLTNAYYAARLPEDVQRTLVGRTESVSLRELKRLIAEHCPKPARRPPTEVEHAGACLRFPGDWTLDRIIDEMGVVVAAARKAVKNSNFGPGDLPKFL